MVDVWKTQKPSDRGDGWVRGMGGDFPWTEFELEDCYSSLNYSAFLLRVGSEKAADELESGHPDLSQKEQRRRLRLYLQELLKKLS